MIPSRKAARLFPILTMLVVVTLLWPLRARAGEPLKVILPEKDNLQHLAFWVAKAGGYFEREGIDIEIVIPPQARQGTTPIDGFLEKGEADAAVAAPSVYLRMIAAKKPIVLVANLLRNDPYALVVRPAIAETRKLTADVPAHDRVVALRGLTIAVPPAAFGRLRALLASQGLDLEKDINAVALLSRDQATPFKNKSNDAAYLATPNLEKTVASGDGVVVVNQARAEVPEIANRQTQLFLVTGRVWTERRDIATAAVRAISEAEKRIHAAQPEVVDILAREFPGRDRRELETAVLLYEPAVPDSTEVRAQDLAPALALIPESVPKPELAGVDFAPFVAPDLARAGANGASRTRRWMLIGGGALTVVAIGLFVRRRRRRTSS